MIYISKNQTPKEQFRQITYLLNQAQNGHHLLFEIDEIREITSKRKVLDVQEAYETEPYLEKLITIASLDEKRKYLKSLDPLVYEKLVLTYFNIIENMLLEKQIVLH